MELLVAVAALIALAVIWCARGAEPRRGRAPGIHRRRIKVREHADQVEGPAPAEPVPRGSGARQHRTIHMTP